MPNPSKKRADQRSSPKKRAAQRSSPHTKSGTPKKSVKRQKQKVTRNCLTPEAKAEKIQLIVSDRQRIIDNKLDEEHHYDALYVKHNLPLVFFSQEKYLCQLPGNVYFSKQRYQMLSK